MDGDTLVVDLVGDAGEAHRDYVVELGQGRLLDELEAGLVGMSIGETKTIEAELAGGSTASIEATVKEIKEKVLPALDDELARSTSEFETVAELRADIESRLRAQLELEVEATFRQEVLRALAVDSGYSETGLSEYLFPYELSFAIHPNGGSEFTIGGLRTVLEQNLDEVVDRLYHLVVVGLESRIALRD